VARDAWGEESSFFSGESRGRGVERERRKRKRKKKKKASISKKLFQKTKKLTEPSRRGLVQVRDRAPQGEVEVETLVGEGLVGLFVWWRRGGREGKRREKA